MKSLFALIIAIAGITASLAIAAKPGQLRQVVLTIKYDSSRKSERYTCTLPEGTLTTNYLCGNAQACPSQIINHEWTSEISCKNSAGDESIVNAYTLHTTSLSPEGERIIAHVAGDVTVAPQATPSPSPTPDTGDVLPPPPTDVFTEIFADGLDARKLIDGALSACTSKATMTVIEPDKNGVYQYITEKGRVCLEVR